MAGGAAGAACCQEGTEFTVAAGTAAPLALTATGVGAGMFTLECKISDGQTAVSSHGVYELAQGKPATQSTTAHGGVAGRATDGNTETQWGGNSCTHSAGGDVMPWWQVDLEKTDSLVAEVDLWNRGDSPTSRSLCPTRRTSRSRRSAPSAWSRARPARR